MTRSADPSDRNTLRPAQTLLGAALQRQAQALRESAGALEQAAAMAEAQAELFERAVVVLRQPSEIVKRAGGVKSER